MRVVITGASGNVGSALLRRLSKEPDVELIGISRRPPRPEHSYDIPWYPIDIAADNAVRELGAAMTGADAVVHLAWVIQPSHDRRHMQAVNRGGTQAVVDAALAAGIGHLVHASSVGAYAPTATRERLDESHPATGVPGSSYSADKAWVERLLDKLEQRAPSIKVARVRSAIVLNEDAAAEILRYFLGPLAVGRKLLGRLPFVPLPMAMHAQLVHVDDLADAYARIVLQQGSGAFNIAGEPILGTKELGAALGGRALPVPAPLMMAGASITWRLHIQPVDSGWIVMAAAAPMMSTQHARAQLGWSPQHDTNVALERLLAAMRAGRAVEASPPLAS